MHQWSIQRSGSGQALALFNKRVLPVLRESGADYELIVTTRQNHARDLVAGQDVWRWRAIVIGEWLVILSL